MTRFINVTVAVDDDEFETTFATLADCPDVVDIDHGREPSLWATVYDVDRAFGGSEEGGWWFDTGRLVKAEWFGDRRSAERRAAELRVEYPANGTSASVLGGREDYRVSVESSEDEPAEFFPAERPYYE